VVHFSAVLGANMKKLLITGVSGFVGGHFVHFLKDHPDEYEIHGIGRSNITWNWFSESSKLAENVTFHRADLLDGSHITAIIGEVQPDYVLHLAAQSSVGESWNTPAVSFINNISGFLNIVEPIRLSGKSTKIVSVGSAEEYGVVDKKSLPLREDAILYPVNPYGAARVAQEHLANIYAEGYGLDICCTRSFNHCGPGQTDRFVASAIAKQFAKISLGKQDPVIEIGDGSIIRDFLDVRDVVVAYALLLKKGVPGQVYNVCSGKGYAISELVTLLADRLQIPVRIHQSPTKRRPKDNPQIIGSNEKIQGELGWHPHIPLADSLQEMHAYWETRLLQENTS
jgi:GDP-4-dehydro-6-deoxy-D-mannose reductase